MTDYCRYLESNPVTASAPCRIDFGGTLDIRTFYLPLSYLSPCTFNMAINMRTSVALLPWKKGVVKISSKGFDTAEFSLDDAPFDHPLGLMFAIAAYFRADGIHIDIDSSSPVRSALGGSSVAAVALIGALSKIREASGEKALSLEEIANLAHAIEECVIGVLCGLQDQLAAAFGGVNAWYWKGTAGYADFRRETVVDEGVFADLEKHLLVAYCGAPHESRDTNGQWIRQFQSGSFRKEWAGIIHVTKNFIDSLVQHNYNDASEFMRQEAGIRRKMTPHVFDNMGLRLLKAAEAHGCGARFTGAGGGGCIWALGDVDGIDQVRPMWRDLLKDNREASLFDIKIDSKGLEVEDRKAT